ncbi:MAG TPA: hypothetical protein VFB72_16645 [Verrucomicrobiae bacterium]|nr:hypothetical protein [Verrucomicrobiae bacterium]
MKNQPPSYTAAQIAAALGITAAAVRMRLAGVVASGEKSVRGQAAKTFALDTLPQGIRDELAAMARERGVKTVDALLSDPPSPWQPPVPWTALSQPIRERAKKLCAALSPALARQHQLSGPDLIAFAQAQYRQHFNRELDADKLRYILDRATKRDNGFKQWIRPELFLDDADFKSASTLSPSTASTTPESEISKELTEALSDIQDKYAPSSLDRRCLFAAAFRHMETADRDGQQSGCKQRLIQWLHTNVPGLCALNRGGDPFYSLRRIFNRKYKQWLSLGRPHVLPPDLRANNSRAGYKHAQCDALITAHAARLRGERGRKGNLDLAIKFLSEKKEICPECAKRYAAGRLTAAARRRLTPNALQVASTKGAHEVRKIAPTHHCQWDTEPGDRFVIDDMTTNELSWDQVDGQVISGQAQLLFTEDEFSSYPLPFFMYYGPPTARTILKELHLVFTHVGLPHLELLTERGVFAARKISGQRGIQHHTDFRELDAALQTMFRFEAAPDELIQRARQMDLGLRDPAFRLSIKQARSPQAKTVERSFYELQKSASRLPGFAGFNQRNEQSKAMQDFDRRVKIGKEHPGNEYLHISALRKNYEAIFEEIKHRPVNGKRHRGLSPHDLWAAAVSEKPLRKLPLEIEALMLTHSLPDKEVPAKGIAIRFNKDETHFYFNGVTGPLVGRRVAVRVNYDIPDFIYIEHPETRQLMKVERALTLRTTATPEEIAKVNRARREHVTGALGQIGNVKNLFTAHVIRDAEHSPADLQSGAQIIADKEEHQRKQGEETRQRKQAAKVAAILGTTAPGANISPARALESLELEREALAELEREQNEKGQP